MTGPWVYVIESTPLRQCSRVYALAANVLGSTSLYVSLIDSQSASEEVTKARHPHLLWLIVKVTRGESTMALAMAALQPPKEQGSTQENQPP